MMAALNASGLYARKAGGGMWNDACIAHTQGYYGDYMDNSKWEVPSGSGMTLAKSLMQWLSSSSNGRTGFKSDAPSNYHVDEIPWPRNKGCAGLGITDKLDFEPDAVTL